MKIKRIAAALVAAVMVVMTMATTVSAESIFNIAKKVDSGKKVTASLFDGSPAYKFTPAAKGTAKIKVTSEVREFHFFVYDEDGKDVEFKYDISMGEYSGFANTYKWNGNAETFKGTFSFDVKAKKTYYVQLELYRFNDGAGTGKIQTSFSYPTEAKAADSTFLTYTLKKGQTAQFGSTDSKATWSSSNKSVATVSSKGVVKGVKKGEAVITVKGSSQTLKIKVIVTA